MSTTDELLQNNDAYVARFDKGELPLPPGKKVAIVACMAARLNPYGALGLDEGDAFVIRFPSCRRLVAEVLVARLSGVDVRAP